LIVEILGTHFCLTLGAWRLRFSLAIEDSEAQHVQTPELVASPPRIAISDKVNRFYPNRR
jgi:hypothetical protein